MSATQQTLAQMVRSKYPGAYDDMDDASLEKSVLAKHPEYSDLPTTKAAPAKSYWEQVNEGLVQGMKDEGNLQARKESGKAAMEMGGAMLGGEGIPALRGLVGAVVRILGAGAGAGAANVGAQAVDTGKVDPTEAAKTAGTFAAGQGIGEVFGAGLPALRSALSRTIYTPEGQLTPIAKAVVHPTELPEQILRKAIPAPPEPPTFPGASEPSAGEFYEKKGADLMKRQAQQDILDRKASATQRLQDRIAAQNAKNAPKSSPFPNATSTSPEEAMFQKNFGKEYKEAGDLAEWETGSRAGNPAQPLASGWQAQQPFPIVQKLSDLKGGAAADDLISRTKTIVRPGEQPTAADLKRAGDLTQVPLAKLKQLASWGDELAKNEIIRRLRNQ